MVVYGKDLTPQHSTSGLRGGSGIADVLHYLGPEESGDRVGLCNLITLQPGASIGVHPHVEDAEIYCFLEGQVTFIENGTEYALGAGDVTYTGNGDSHGVVNSGSVPATILAVVVK